MLTYFKFLGGCQDLMLSGHTLFIWVTVKFTGKMLNYSWGWVYLTVNAVESLYLIAGGKWHYSLDIAMAVFFAHYMCEFIYLIHRQFLKEVREEEREMEKLKGYYNEEDPDEEIPTGVKDAYGDKR
eukprot:CAMPEP_0114584182 /NCGR_PEP_ID=MMETSP0125-20121206/7905_1 /TAXON_ID=485358 ORGANISM="Aristerostoma sp., Strain ATCC 50986" /NCGR_SAMPLE_ID=MMETSP0125 /ASSEMBLY_ACC=CAM_ASM_000245 /LENGTH=125 /DNA_ID=CAMNT_0001778363 /DNA_START=256 /DNA_END=633 /DNA_ORIENTATION=-